MKGEKILIAGVVLDLLFTYIGIFYFNLTEGNYLGLMNVTILNILVILTAIWTIRKERNKTINNGIIIIGISRVLISIWNISLFFK